MFLTTRQAGYNRDGGQVASGMFLMLFQEPRAPGEVPRLRPELRAIVRSVRLEQFGHFMMGSAQIAGERFILSGAYGEDGLPMDCPKGLWNHLIQLPSDLAEAFWEGGGHNSAGSEAPAMRKWATENLTRLRKAGTHLHRQKGEQHA